MPLRQEPYADVAIFKHTITTMISTDSRVAVARGINRGLNYRTRYPLQRPNDPAKDLVEHQRRHS